MMNQSLKPESAIRKADELLSLGMHEDVNSKERILAFSYCCCVQACDVLYQNFSNRRWRHQYTDTLEKSVLKCLDICVDHHMARWAKDTLQVFKTTAQNQAPLALENVFRKFMDMAEAKVAKAKEYIQANGFGSIRNLEESESPETVLLASIEGHDLSEGKKCQAWFRFMWDAYKIVLELAKQRAKLEPVYLECVQRALKFCVEHERTLELRKLMETVRDNWARAMYSAMQGRERPTQVNPLNPDVQSRMLSVRIEFLKATVELQSWKDCLTATEDTHALMLKKKPSPDQLQLYQDALAKYLHKSNYPLLHAHASLRHFILLENHKENSESSEEAVKASADRALVAALAIPPAELRSRVFPCVSSGFQGVVEQASSFLASGVLGQSDEMSEKERERRERKEKLSTMISSQGMPKREDIIREVQDRALSHASPSVSALFKASIEGGDGLAQKVEALPKPMKDLYEKELRESLTQQVYLSLSGRTSEISLQKLSEAVSPLLGVSAAHCLAVEMARGELIKAEFDFEKKTARFSPSMGEQGFQSLEQIARGLVSKKASELRKQYLDQHCQKAAFLQKLHKEKELMEARLLRIESRSSEMDSLAAKQEKRRQTIAAEREKREAEVERKRQEEERIRIEREKMKKKKGEEQLKMRKEYLEDLKKQATQLAISQKSSGALAAEKENVDAKFFSKNKDTSKKMVSFGKIKVDKHFKEITELTDADLMKLSLEEMRKAVKDNRMQDRNRTVDDRKSQAKFMSHLARAIREKETQRFEAVKEDLAKEDKEFFDSLAEKLRTEKEERTLRMRKGREILTPFADVRDSWLEIEMEPRKEERERLVLAAREEKRRELCQRKLAKALAKLREKVEDERDIMGGGADQGDFKVVTR